MEEVAKNLGVSLTSADGKAVPAEELRVRVLAAMSVLKEKADSSHLLGSDGAPPDCVIRVRTALGAARDRPLGELSVGVRHRCGGRTEYESGAPDRCGDGDNAEVGDSGRGAGLRESSTTRMCCHEQDSGGGEHSVDDASTLHPCPLLCLDADNRKTESSVEGGQPSGSVDAVRAGKVDGVGDWGGRGDRDGVNVRKRLTRSGSTYDSDDGAGEASEGSNGPPSKRPRYESQHQEEIWLSGAVRPELSSQSLQSSAAAGTSRCGAAATAEVEGALDGVRVIRAHSHILAVRSRYFMRVFANGFRETQSRIVDVELGGDEDFEDLKLLIELSYTPSYTVNSLTDEPLEIEQLRRLMIQADAFEFASAVTECACALRNRVTPAEAMEILDNLPDHLVTAYGTLQDMLPAAAQGLAETLGSIATLFRQREATAFTMRRHIFGVLELDDRVKGLSPLAMEALLQSDHLRVVSENDAYWLLEAWLEHRTVTRQMSNHDAQAAFNRLVKHIRLRHLSLDFLSCIVAFSKMWRACPDSWGMMSHAVSNRSRVHGPKANPTPARSHYSELARSACVATFTRQDVEAVPSGSCLRCYAGLVHGFPLQVVLKNRGADRYGLCLSTGLQYIAGRLAEDQVVYLDVGVLLPEKAAVQEEVAKMEAARLKVMCSMTEAKDVKRAKASS